MKKTEEKNNKKQLREYLFLKKKWHEEQLKLADRQIEEILYPNRQE